MKHKYLFFLLSIFIISSCNTERSDKKEIVLEEFTLKCEDSLNSIESTLPSSIHAELIKSRIIEDPFDCCNVDSLNWINKKNWIYSFEFNISEEDLAHNSIMLIANGIDTYSEIILNGGFIARTNNSFKEYEIDIKKFLKIGENKLEIKLNQIEIEELKREWEYGLKMPGGNRVFTRKAQFQYGWDWALALNDRGIYNKIKIEFFNKAKINNVNIRSLQVNKDFAILEFNSEIHSLQKSDYKLEINNKIFDIKAVKGNNILKNKIKIEEPDLWWPHNYGDQNLYEFDIKITYLDEILDKKTIKYGIRDVKLNQDSLPKGSKFSFIINGQEIYMKGANIIPSNHFLSEASDSSYIELVKQAKAANMNMLRVWGGGYYLPDAFYEACDKEGIAVWQDFMFAGGMYPISVFDSVEIEQQIKRLNNHSSIVLWCGNNEISEGWHNWGWAKNYNQKEKDKIWGDYKFIFQELIPNKVKDLSSNTPYWESSPKLGRGNPEYIHSGNAHNWWVWHDDSLFENYERQIPRFMTEFGFQSFPHINTTKRFAQNNIYPNANELNYHQKHAHGFERIQSAMQRNLPQPYNLEDSVYLSQVLQALAVETGIRAQRTDEYCKGSLFWQLNDCWPVISWSAIDFYGYWKALMYRAKKSFDDVVIRSEIQGDSIVVWLGSELDYSPKAILNASILDFNGNEVYSKSTKLELKENFQGKLHSFTGFSNEIDWTMHYIKISIEVNDKTYKNISFNRKLKDLKLNKYALEYEIKRNKINFKAKELCLFVAIQNNDKKLEDNYFHLEAGEEKTIKIEDSEAIIQMLNNYY